MTAEPTDPQIRSAAATIAAEQRGFADEIGVEPTTDPRVMVRRGADATGGITFAGHLAAQMLVAAGHATTEPIRSIRSTFLRRVDPGEEATHLVDTMHSGRTLQALRVTTVQAGELRAVADVIAGPGADGPTYAPEAPDAPAPSDCEITPFRGFRGEVRMVNGVDLFNADQTLPPHVKAWVRDRGTDPLTSSAHLALAANSFVVGAALLPHAGLGLGAAHASLVTSILSSEIIYYQPPEPASWLLFEVTIDRTAAGWTSGGGIAFSAEGIAVASFDLHALLRYR